MEGLPLVSIVTPSFNQGRFLRRTIESVLGQGYPRIEYIVCDGGSTDGSREILGSYGDRLRWDSQPDAGQSAALNRGFAGAHGEVFAYLNSDDLLRPGAVEAVVQHLARNAECDLVYGDADYVDEEGLSHRRVLLLAPGGGERRLPAGGLLALARRRASGAVQRGAALRDGLRVLAAAGPGRRPAGAPAAHPRRHAPASGSQDPGRAARRAARDLRRLRDAARPGGPDVLHRPVARPDGGRARAVARASRPLEAALPGGRLPAPQVVSSRPPCAAGPRGGKRALSPWPDPPT
ncbi:MAG: hypothetical protein DMF81_00015 [Acidobacteria bacterium]|nr:MAG: hypothetical protein DMF81_00015 [Acidobacteriota bacterium]